MQSLDKKTRQQRDDQLDRRRLLSLQATKKLILHLEKETQHCPSFAGRSRERVWRKQRRGASIQTMHKYIKKLKLEAEHSVLLYLNYNMYVVALAQLVRFLVMKLIHPDSILRFDICVPFTANYSFSERRRLHRQ
jgi:hypothetical protein